MDLFMRRINTLIAGRDKLCRTVQYGCRVLWYLLDQKRFNNGDIIESIKKLEVAISTARKMLRFGKSYDVLISALKSIHLQDVVLRLTLTLNKIAFCLYLLADHVDWLGRVGVINRDPKRWSLMINRYWLVMIMMGLIRDLYEIFNIFEEEIAAAKRMRSRETKSALVKKIVLENRSLFVDSVKNATDLVLPLTSLGYLRASPGITGVCGFISSLLGMAAIMNPDLKLVPS